MGRKSIRASRGMKVSATRKGFYMFSRDLLSSRKYRCCSWVAKGVYLDLLNVLAVQPKPGAISLSSIDLKPKNERSLTFRCLQCQKKAKNGEYQSIKYFAEAIAVSGASGPRPGLIHGLQELYLRGMIIVEGDTLIQPRMYIDNGYELTDENGNVRQVIGDEIVSVGSPDDAAGDPDAEAVRMGTKKGAENAPLSTSKNAQNSRTRAQHAPVRQESESKSNNNIDKKGVQGETGDTTENTSPNSSGGKKSGFESEKEGEVNNSTLKNKKRADAPSKAAKKASVADNPPTLEDIQAYFSEREAQGKPFLYVTAENFLDACEQSGWTLKDGKPIRDWKARLRTFETYRRDKGDRPVTQQQPKVRKGEPVPQTEGKNYNDW